MDILVMGMMIMDIKIMGILTMGIVIMGIVTMGIDDQGCPDYGYNDHGYHIMIHTIINMGREMIGLGKSKGTLNIIPFLPTRANSDSWLTTNSFCSDSSWIRTWGTRGGSETVLGHFDENEGTQTSKIKY